MKLGKINIVNVLVLGMVLAFTSCSKDDGSIPERVSIEDVPVITTNLEAGGTTATITLANQAAFEGKFKVALYFANALAPTKVDMVVRKNGVAASVKLFKADVTAFPTSFSVKAADIATIFGAPLATKDTYDFAPDIFVKDKKYEAFPVTGNGNGQGVTGMSAIGFGEYVRFTVN